MKLYRVLGREGKITIPHAIRQHIGFQDSDIVSFELVSGDAVLVRRESILSRDGVPVDGDMPCLKDFLESLSDKEQYAALVHLSVLWAENHGKKPGEGNHEA